ncbi:MAG: glycosyltransferase family 4 protein [Wolinella sp.]
MKIVFLSHIDINLYLFRRPIMEALLARGHDVIALVPEGKYSENLRTLGIKVIYYGISRSSLNPLKELKTLLEIAKILRSLKPDILHTFMLKPNIYGALAARFAGISCVVCSVTGLGSFYIDNSLKARMIRGLTELLNRLAFMIAKRVVFQNGDDLSYFVERGVVKYEKARLIRGSGIDTIHFSMDAISPSVVKEYKENLNADGKILVLMVARAIAHKGVREFYEAARLLRSIDSLSKESKIRIDKNSERIAAKNSQKEQHIKEKIKFVYVGDSDTGNPSSISAHELESPYVKWLGHRDDVREIVAACDIFVLPSYREGIPRTLLEASSMAKPMITCDTVGCKEVVSDGENGLLVPVGEARILADKIALLADDENLRARFGDAARARAEREFDVKNIVESHLKLYKEVANV